MDITKAKEFIFLDTISSLSTGKIYVSKDVHKLIEMNGGTLISIFAVIDTENGEKLFYMDFSYSGEPLIFGVFIHKDFFMRAYSHLEIVNV